MRRCAARCSGAAVFVALSLARAVAAEPNGAETPAETANRPLASLIEVEREPAAAACPDADAVFRSIARLFPERAFRRSADAATAVASARVVIRALPAGYEAVLSMRAPHAGERVILEKDQRCGGLADALALAFVMLVEPPVAKPPPESGAGAPPASATAGAPLPEAAAPAPPTPKKQPARSELPPANSADRTSGFSAGAARRMSSFVADVAAAGVAGVGLLSEPAGGATLGVELFHESGWGMVLDGVRLWSPPAAAQGGSVTLTLWAFLGGPCYARRLNKSSSLDACIRFGVGPQHAEVKGFVAPASGDFPWMVLAPSVGYRLGSPKVLSGFVRVGPVGQLRPQSFSARSSDATQTLPIAGAPKFGVMAELGVSAGDFGF